jgi:D-inositol-3-phosphate glycosyltransferase
VGGLTTVVRDGVTGLLVDGHDPANYARAMSRLVEAPAYRDRLGSAAAVRARGFAWERTADLTLDVYRKAARAMRHDLALGAMHG